MKPTPPPLRWLTDKHARIAGKLEKCRETLAEMRAHTAMVLARAAAREASVEAVVERLIADLASIDRVVRVYDNALDTSTISPVNAWQGVYGRRGDLRLFLAITLKQQSPDWVPVNHLGLLAMKHFSLSFDTKRQQVLWQKGSVRTALAGLRQAGLVERVEGSVNAMGQWRWKQHRTPTLAELRAYSEPKRSAAAVEAVQ